MGWRCVRKLKRIAKIVTDATAGAYANPVPGGDEHSDQIYLGDMMALAMMQRELYSGGKSWQDDSTECGRQLRDIASVLEAWSGLHDYLEEEYPGDAERQVRTRANMERNMLASIGWLIVGKTMDEIRHEQSGAG